ncbi:MAG: DUF3570 domain-containing protein [Pseudomonadota bacterium]
MNSSSSSSTMPAHGLGASILAAALALPGLGIGPAHAANPPEHGEISVKYLDYQDRQSGLERTSVHAPSLSIMTPVAGVWSVAGSLTSDDVSGASPRYHSAISSASHMADRRNAADLGLTRYFERASVSAGAAFSTEHDYVSRAFSLQAALESEDKNTTLAVGIGRANDSINPVSGIVSGERKQTNSFMLGVTQVLTPRDIVQLSATYARGHGYFSDPYKLLDNRPRQHNETAVLTRWNHHFTGTDGTSRVSYRYYNDSYKTRAHTFTGEYLQPLPSGWSVTPSARYHSQNAAGFYYDPVYDSALGQPFPPGYLNDPGYFSSADQRLSAFGAITLGIKVAKQLDSLWSVNLKLEAYQQRGSWRLFEQGSPGLAPLRAHMLQIGVNRQW